MDFFKLITFLAFFLLSGFSQDLHAADCMGKGEKPTDDKDCCSGLNLTGGICVDPSPQDASLKTCTSNAECSGGQGCFVQRPEDMYTNSSSSEEAVSSAISAQDTLEKVLDLLGFEPKALGSACILDSQCESYNCSKFKCTEKKICRFGALGEMTAGYTQCETGLMKSASGICILKPEDQNQTYLGLIDEVTFQQVGTNACQFSLDEEVRLKSIVAMKSLRAMEWLFATTGVANHEDCLGLLPYLRDQIGKPYSAERQVILQNFNITLANIEKDNQALLTAQKKSPVMTSIHGVAISQKDLESRKPSGYDMLMLMYRRNLLFQSYEVAMLQLNQKYYEKVMALSLNFGLWDEKSKEWDVGSTHYSADMIECRSNFLNRKIWKRWAQYYVASSFAPRNASVTLPTSPVGIQLNTIYDVGAFPHAPYIYLIDPLMPGDYGSVKFEDFGIDMFLTSGLRRRSLYGSPNSTLEDMKGKFRDRLGEYYKRLRSDPTQINYVYEPELVSTVARDCFDKPGNPSCSDFNKFLDELNDVAFAQFLAYSVHTRNDYKDYYKKATTWRRKLFAHYEVSFQNITEYYDKISVQRNLQNECIEKVINQVATDYLDSTANGLNEGTNYYAAPGTTTASSGNQVDNLLLTTGERGKYQFNLSTGALGSLSMNGSVGTTSKGALAGSGTFGNTLAAAAMANRLSQLASSNTKAQTAGLNLAEMEEELEEDLAQAAGFSGASDVGANTVAAMPTQNSPTISSSKDKDGSPTGTGVKAYGPSTGHGFSGFGSLSTSSGGSNSESTYKDPTGMSDEEKEVIMANYERNKSHYQTGEEDNLFKILSKAYVRSLDKVLTKKKKIE